MEQKTIACPACGAPLKYSDEQETLRCGYCDADLKIVRTDDTTSFEVIAQPEPQKEVLNKPVLPHEPPMVDTANASAYDTPQPDAPSTSSAPSFFTEPQRSEPFTPDRPIPAPPAFSAAGDSGAQVYPPAAPARSGAPTWLWVILGVVGGLCLLCACMAVAAVVLLNATGVTF